MSALVNLLPGAHVASSEGGLAVEMRSDLLRVFEACVIQAERFSGESSVDLLALRHQMLEMVRKVANIVQREMPTFSSVRDSMGHESRGKVEEDDKRNREMSDSRRQVLELEAKVVESETETVMWRERAEEVTERLKRMAGHVTRVEMAMDQMEAKFEEEKKAMIAPSPMSASSSSLVSRMIMKSSTGIVSTGVSATSSNSAGAMASSSGEASKPTSMSNSASPSAPDQANASSSNMSSDLSIQVDAQMLSSGGIANVSNLPLFSSSPAPGADGPSGELSVTSSLVISMPTWEDLQLMESEKAEVTRELEEAKILLQRRLAEITSLSEEKSALSQKCAGIELRLSVLGAGEEGEIEDVSRIGSSGVSGEEYVGRKSLKLYVDDEVRVLQAAVTEVREQLVRSQLEAKKAQEAYESAKKQLENTVRSEMAEYRGKVERMSAKLKGMEAERDRTLHLLAVADTAAKEALSHVPHYQTLLKRHTELTECLERSKKANEDLQRQVESSTDAIALKRLEHALQQANSQIQYLTEGWMVFAKKEVNKDFLDTVQAQCGEIGLKVVNGSDENASKVGDLKGVIGIGDGIGSRDSDVSKVARDSFSASDSWSSSSHSPPPSSYSSSSKLEFIVNCVRKVGDLSVLLKSSLERVEEGRVMSEHLESALEELSVENDKLSAEVAERESRMSSLMKERVNSNSSAQSAKRLGAIETALTSSVKSQYQSMERLLSDERSEKEGLRRELNRKESECQALKQHLQQLDQFKIQSTLAIDLLKKRLDHWHEKVKVAETTVKQSKQETETLRASSARLQEELDTTQRSLTSMKKDKDAAATKTGETTTTSSSSSSDVNKLNKVISMYRSLFNCSLCSHQRQVNCSLIPCGHTFCRTCIDTKCVAARNRKCPKCKVSFGQSDIRELFF